MPDNELSQSNERWPNKWSATGHDGVYREFRSTPEAEHRIDALLETSASRAAYSRAVWSEIAAGLKSGAIVEDSWSVAPGTPLEKTQPVQTLHRDALDLTIVHSGVAYHTDRATAELLVRLRSYDQRSGNHAMEDAAFAVAMQAGRILPGEVLREEVQHANRPQVDLGQPVKQDNSHLSEHLTDMWEAYREEMLRETATASQESIERGEALEAAYWAREARNSPAQDQVLDYVRDTGMDQTVVRGQFSAAEHQSPIQYGATSSEVERGVGPVMAAALTDRSPAYQVNPEMYEAVPAPQMAPAITDRTSAREVMQGAMRGQDEALPPEGFMSSARRAVMNSYYDLRARVQTALGRDAGTWDHPVVVTNHDGTREVMTVSERFDREQAEQQEQPTRVVADPPLRQPGTGWDASVQSAFPDATFAEFKRANWGASEGQYNPGAARANPEYEQPQQRAGRAVRQDRGHEHGIV